MQECTYNPEGILSRYVKFIWCSENYVPESSKERVLPSGSSQLIFNLEGKSFRHFEGDKFQELLYSPSILAGIQTRHIFLDSFSRRSTMGVVLKPGAVYSLFKIPANEFRDKVIPLNNILKTDVSELREKLISVSAPEDKFSLLESYLLNLLDLHHKINPAVLFAIKQMHEQHGSLQVSRIINKTGYSRRWFSKIFSDSVGLSPKHYSRIQRLQHVLGQLRTSGNANLASLSVSNGYFDQAHFIHDFKDLAGISPVQYYKNHRLSANHLVV